jgi:fumarylacetoacetase
MGTPQVIARSNFQNLYWSINQQLAHHTINGCNLRTGDLLASGTISGEEPTTQGCLLELTRRGACPLALPDGQTRGFLEDGDRVTFHAWCGGHGCRVGWGTCTGELLPALPI